MNILKFFNFLLFKTNKYVFIISLLIIQLANSYFFVLVAEFTNNANVFEGANFKNLSKPEILMLTVIVIPILETTIFQYGIIKLSRLLTKNIHLGVVLSALLFGLGHSYNIWYVTNMILSGLIFGYAFIIAEKRKYSPFWCVFIIHSLYNMCVFIDRTFLT